MIELKKRVALITVCVVVMIVAIFVTSAARAQESVKAQWNNHIIATHACEKKLPRTLTQVVYSPWKPHNTSFRKAQRDKWKDRRDRCQDALQEKQRQWNWQEWLPGNWYSLGSCETGYGGPPNWHHYNSSFRSAFGISTAEYDADARYMGVRPWFVSGKGDPTPWEQYMAAKGHYKRFGDGWDCPGP